MAKYCFKKLAQLIVILFLISIFSFAIIYIAPGDISSMYLTPEMTDEERQIVIEKLGLDKTLHEQYIGWLSEAVRGTLGMSLAFRTPVNQLFLLCRNVHTIILFWYASHHSICSPATSASFFWNTHSWGQYTI